MILIINILVVLIAFLADYLTADKSLKLLLKHPSHLFKHEKKQSIRQFTILVVIMLAVTDILFLKLGSLQAASVVPIFLFLEIVFMLLIFLSYYDWVTMEIPFLPTFTCVAIALAGCFAVLLSGQNYIELWQNNFFSAPSSILAGIIAGTFIGIIVLLTKERGMGKGDIYLAVIMGLMLGIPKIFIAFYIAVFSATAVGLIKAYRKKKLKGLRMPFVPFISLAIISTTLFWAEIFYFVTQTLGLKYIF